MAEQIKSKMGVIASEAKQSLMFQNEIATAWKPGLAMTFNKVVIFVLNFLCLLKREKLLV